MELSSSSSSSATSYSEISPWMFDTASFKSSERSALSNGSQVASGPKRPLTIFISPSIISGCWTKYEFILIPFSSVSRWTQSGSMSISLSRFCRNRISDTTSVPALPLKVSFGSLIAPRSSALCAIYLRTLEFSLSIVPLLVTRAITPPGRNLSSDFAKK